MGADGTDAVKQFYDPKTNENEMGDAERPQISFVAHRLARVAWEP